MADKKKKRSGKSKKEADKPAELVHENPAAVVSASQPAPPTAGLTPVVSSTVGMPSPRNLAKSFSFVLLLAIIGLIGVLSYRVMSSFILPLFLAALLVVIFRPVHEWIQRRCGDRNSLAAGFTTAAILLVALGPVTWMVVAGVREGMDLTERSWQSDFEKLSEAREALGLEMPFPDDLADIQAQLNSLVLKDDRTNSSVEVKGKQQLLVDIGEQLREFKQLLFADALKTAGEVGGTGPLATQLQSYLAADTRSFPDGVNEKVENAKSVIGFLDAIDVDPLETDGAQVPSPISQLRKVTEAAQREDGASPAEIDEYKKSVGLIRDRFAWAQQNLSGGDARAREFAEAQALFESLALRQDGTKPSAQVKNNQQQVAMVAAKLDDLKILLLIDALSVVEEVGGASPQLTRLDSLLPEPTKEDESSKEPAESGKEAVSGKEVLSDKAIDKIENAKRVIGLLDRIDVDQPESDQPEAAPSPLKRLKEIAEAARREQGVSVTEIDQYEETVGLISGQYALARQTLMGGIGWAPIVELLNPSKARIDELRIYAAEKLRSWMLKLTGQTTSLMSGLLMQLFVFTVATFYFLADGPQMISSAMQLSPMDDKHEAEIIAEFAKLSRAVVVATLLSAIVQGVLAGFGYFAVWGFDSLFVLIMLTTILAMIPFVGAAAVWVPACIYLAFIEKRIPAAIGLAVYGACIVSMADNVIKPWVLRGQSNLHPLFALLSVLGGVGALGPIGVLVGPMVVAFLQSLLKILHKEMHGIDSGVLDQKMA